jgi:hypothetical protein
MGRETHCRCDWGGAVEEVKALLESPELILRGGLRRRLPFARLEQVRADGDHLRFRFEGDEVALALGKARTAVWMKAFLTPPPSLARKLGIAPDSCVRTFGEMDAPELQEALGAARRIQEEEPDLIVARVETREELARALRGNAEELAAGVPIWLVYPKGKGQSLTESEVRTTALAAGIVDTKVAAISAKLTGLRFVKRKAV